MPVFNNAATIRRAIESLLAQSRTDLRLVISDDGSTDGTADICDEYAARDSRVSVERQQKNLNYGNFRFVLQRARTPYFMFAAGDDWWHPTFVERMIGALGDEPRAVCAVSRVEFVRPDGASTLATGTKPLTGDAPSNIAQFLAAGDDNSRMYGVFRTDVAQRAFPPRDFFAYDWAFSVGTLLEGSHLEIPEVLLWRDYTNPDRYVAYVRRDARRAIDRVFPLFPFTRDVIGRLRIPLTYAIARELFWLNADFHLHYLQRFHPAGARTSNRILQTINRAAGAARKRLR